MKWESKDENTIRMEREMQAVKERTAKHQQEVNIKFIK